MEKFEYNSVNLKEMLNSIFYFYLYILKFEKLIIIYIYYNIIKIYLLKNQNLKKLILEYAFFQLGLVLLIIIYNNNYNNYYSYSYYYYFIDWLNLTLGFDNMSLVFIFLTCIIYIVCILINWNLKYKVKEYLFILSLINILLILVFFILDLFLFYIYFESILIPMFILIGVWGSRNRKIQAAYKFFLYTLFGSLFMLVGLFNLYSHLGTCDLRLLENVTLSYYRQILISFCFLMAFAVKIPLYPFHLWLPEAHVEASTAGSVILAVYF